jgi:hypothetical protein
VSGFSKNREIPPDLFGQNQQRFRYAVWRDLCLGALIASNFVILDIEEREHAEAKEHSRSQAHAHA